MSEDNIPRVQALMDEMEARDAIRRKETYASRSSAVRAARNACKRALDAPFYQAFEGPDYAIHPVTLQSGFEQRWEFELRGPAKDAVKA